MRKEIQSIFVEIPETYEQVNHILTLGMDMLWRRKLVRAAAGSGGERVLDICCGTGETTAAMRRKLPRSARVYGVDFARPMLSVAEQKPESDRISFIVCDVEHLPFKAGMFDTLTLSFATRNLHKNREQLTNCFRGFQRVLKPGGTYFNLESSQPREGLIRRLFHLYIRLAVRPVGRLISGSDPGYEYLSSSMQVFYSPEELAEILTDAGFSPVRFRRFFFGAAALHTALKDRDG